MGERGGKGWSLGNSLVLLPQSATGLSHQQARLLLGRSKGPKGHLRGFSPGIVSTGQARITWSRAATVRVFWVKMMAGSFEGHVLRRNLVASGPWCVFLWTSEIDWPEFKSQLSNLPATWAWAHYAISWATISAFIKMGRNMYTKCLVHKKHAVMHYFLLLIIITVIHIAVLVKCLQPLGNIITHPCFSAVVEERFNPIFSRYRLRNGSPKKVNNLPQFTPYLLS